MPKKILKITPPSVDTKQLQKLDSWETRPRRRTPHPRPWETTWTTSRETHPGRHTQHLSWAGTEDGRQADRQDRGQAEIQAQEGGHSIAEHLENMGDKAKNKRKTNPARRTQQSSQGRHAEKETLKTPTVNCLGKNDFGRLGSCCFFLNWAKSFEIHTMSSPKRPQ